MKKILLTGVTGFLGSRIYQCYKDKYEIHAPKRDELDLADEMQVLKYAENILPDIVIHTAAISDIAYAQNHKEEHFNVNIRASENLAKACKKVEAKMIFASSDQVYSGHTNTQASQEDDVKCQDQVYGCGKLEAEGKIAEILPTAVNLRLTWMYDIRQVGNKNKSHFLNIMIRNLEEQNVLTFQDKGFRGITYVKEVVDNIEKVFEIPGGNYNFGSPSEYTTFGIAKNTAKLLGMDENLIKADSNRDSVNLAMSIDKINKLGIDFSSTMEGIEKAIKEYTEYNETKFAD